MIAIYKSSPLYQELAAKTRKSYDAALQLASQHKLKHGRTFGSAFGIFHLLALLRVQLIDFMPD